MITVIIPCYNCENFIQRAVNSVLNQTYTDWELILVNNNSTDGTQNALELFKRDFPEKISILQETTKGAPTARNKGLVNAKGKWIQYLDADDELLPYKLEHQIALAEKESVDIIIGNASIIENKDGKTITSLRPVYTTDVWIGLISSKLGITSAIIWKKEILKKVKGWDENLTSSQEYDLMFRLLKSGAKVGFDSRVETLIYKSGNSISKDPDKFKMLAIIDNRIRLRLQIMEYLDQIRQLTKDRKAMIHKYIYEELSGNQIDVADYQRTKLNGVSIQVPFTIILDQNWKRIKRSFLSTLKSYIKKIK